MNHRFADLIELFETSTEKFSAEPLFGTKTEVGWRWLSYGDFYAQVERLKGGLASIGIGPGDKVAIISNNRVEWAAAFYATLGLGGAIVPMYEAQLPKEWQFILTDSGARAVFAATEEIRAKLARMRIQLPALQHIIGFNQPADEPFSYLDILDRGRTYPPPEQRATADALAALIYTSGTTGLPKGVLLTHGSIASNVSAVIDSFDFGKGDRSLSFLPWSHAYGLTCELNGMIAKGVAVAINDALPKLLDNLREVRPTILIAVPRVFTRIAAAVNQELELRPRIVQKLVRVGLQAAVRRSHGEHLGILEELGLAVDERLLFTKVREKLGGELRYAISGAAALSKEVAEMIDALGIAVYEGYGLSEAGPIVSANCPGSAKIGSVGKIIADTRVVLQPVEGGEPGTGEIVVYGPGVMKGYHNRLLENAEAFTADGGLRTGDLGRLDEDGYLYITGRIKDQYKLENGKYVMPGPLEEELKLSRYISNVMLYGANRAYNVAVVVVDRVALEKWAAERKLELGDISNNPAVAALIEAEVKQHSTTFKPFEIPKRCVITTDEFTIEGGMLTPTLKVKRKEVLAKYGAAIERLYEAAAA